MQRKHSGFNEVAYQKALAELERLLAEGDDSDTSWQDDLSEAPEFPEGPEDTVAVVIRKPGATCASSSGACPLGDPGRTKGKRPTLDGA